MKLRRRHFLSLAAGAATGASLARLPELKRRLFPRGALRVRRGPGIERQVATTCELCPACCGVLARVVDGHVVKLEGNPLSPVNRGGLCALGQAGVHLLHSPERIRGPLLRNGPRGTASFEPISWERATELVAARLRDAVQSGQPQGVVAVDGGSALTSLLWGRLLEALGSPNHLIDRAEDPMAAASRLTGGPASPPGYDFENTRFLLSLGAPLFESWWSPVQMQRLHASRSSASGRSRMRLVHFDTRFSVTAALADEWHAVRPGGFLPLALSFAYVIVKESLHDAAFVKDHCVGFESYTDSKGRSCPGFRELLFRDCSPEKLASASGVSPDIVHRLAKELARDLPGLVVADPAVTDHPSSIRTAWAVTCLDALLGSIERPGGLIFPDSYPKLSVQPPAAGAGDREGPASLPIGDRSAPLASETGGLEDLLEALSTQEAPRPSTLFLHRSNPLYSHPDPDRVRQAFDKVPFIVSFSPYRDETSLAADLLLPDSMYLERWDVVCAPPASGRNVVGVCQPAIAPRHDTRATADFLLGLAKSLGPRYEQAIPWKSSAALVSAQVDVLFRARRGTVFTDPLEEAQLDAVQERGWWFATHPESGAFEKAFREKGGWWDPTHHHGRLGRVFRNPSRRFQFRSELLASWVDRRVDEVASSEGNRDSAEVRREVLSSIGLPADETEAYFPLAGTSSGLPDTLDAGALWLVAYRPLTRTGETLGRLPVLRDVLGMHLTGRPLFWVEVNPRDAASRGLPDGKRVRVSTSAGSIVATIRLTETSPPGVIAVPYGFGQVTGGAISVGQNVLRLLPARLDPLDRRSGWGPVAARLAAQGGEGRDA